MPGFWGVSFYEAVSTTANLEQALGSLVRACRLPAADWAQWREELRAQSPDLMAAVAYMKERWVSLTGQSLARCDPTRERPKMPPGVMPPFMPLSYGPGYCDPPFPIWIQSKEEQAQRTHNQPSHARKPAPNRR
jgi:hypothetical protein